MINLFDSIKILKDKYKYPRNELELLNYKIDINEKYRSILSNINIMNIVNDKLNLDNYKMKIKQFRKDFLENTRLVYL